MNPAADQRVRPVSSRAPVVCRSCFFAFCSGAGAAEKVRISVTNYNMSYLAAGVAAKKGFFREEGLDVEIIRMNFNVAMSGFDHRRSRLHDDLRLRDARCHERHSAQGQWRS